MRKTGTYELVFNHLDENRDGKLSPSELTNRLGLVRGDKHGSLLLQEAEMVVGLCDSDGDGLLGPEDLVALMEAGGDEEKLQDLREAFGMYDVENCGYITPKNLKRMFSRLGESKSVEECKVMIKKFDLNGDGVLCFEEFRIMMM